MYDRTIDFQSMWIADKNYILSVLKRGGSIIVTNYIKLYDENENFVCCLSDADLEAVREILKEE